MRSAPGDDALSGLTGGVPAAAAQSDLAGACVLAVRRACAATGRRRVILSGSLHPATAAAILAALGPEGIEIERLAPDPLGVEDLAGRTARDLAALVVQTPDPFGGLRSFGLAASLCREDGTVPVAVIADPALLALSGPPDADLVAIDGCAPRLGLSQPLGLLYGRAALAGGGDDAAQSPALRAAAGTLSAALADEGLAVRARAARDAADRIAARMRRVRGRTVMSGERFATVALYLGDDGDAAAAARRLPRLSGIEAVPAARLYPGWPELRPLLLLSVTGAVGDDAPDRLAAVLAEGVS